MQRIPKLLNLRHMPEICIGDEDYVSLPVALKEPIKAVICRHDCDTSLPKEILDLVDSQIKRHLSGGKEYGAFEYYCTIVPALTNNVQGNQRLEVEIRSSFTDYVHLRVNWWDNYNEIAEKVLSYHKQ